MLFDENSKRIADHHPIFGERGNSLLGMGFEPMRLASTDLKPVSLTNSDILVKEDHFIEYFNKALAGIEPALRGLLRVQSLLS